MKKRYLAALVAVTAAVPAAFIVATAAPGTAAETPHGLTATALSPTSRASAAKSPTSRLAQTDPALLNRSDTKPIAVVVKMDYDSVATYAGDVAGYAATSPAVTGRPLSNSSAERKYESRLANLEHAFADRLAKKVPSAKVGRALRTVYGGVAVTMPANKVADVLAIPGVVAVQQDQLRQPLTDSSPDFIGATSLYPSLGGTADAGKGVIFGSLDSGVWPEHPSFADNGNLGAPPPKADGTPRTCDFGDNPLTPATDVFACNHKLIGGQPFIDTYNAVVGGETYPDTARDSEGHGTHTASTAAGDPVAHTPTLGVDRGAINGIAPGAWVSVYKVCGAEGCFSSDSAAAVGQAIKDGVNVINFSISGGTDPFTDAVELAFLDAYAAGVFVATSAGNEGPGAGTVNHLSPWVTSVAASTQTRAFESTLTLTDGAASATFHGASITAGAGPAPVVFSSAPPYNDDLCQAPAPAGTFTGKIVACKRGTNARVDKGFNVKQGGAAGMILYNPTLADVETDNHWLPAVHLADGTDFVAFLTAHPNATASFTAGAKVNGQGDVMAAFSSRGPAGLILKPDITAPGVQILAGQTPTPDSISVGPPGEFYQAIAGTSMSSPHIAGSAILLKALHPSWTPGQIKSALMTTATTDVVKEDLTTPADPLDMGSGRVNLTVAGNPGLTFDETAANMAALGNDEVRAVDMNLPSVDAKVMPGTLVTTRVATNVTNRSQKYTVSTKAPAGSSITVRPSSFTVKPGKSQRLTITIKSSAPTGQYFGQITLKPSSNSLPDLHLPVAFVPKQGKVTLTSACTPDEIKLLHTSTCTITAANFASVPAEVDLATETSLRLPVVDVTGAKRHGLFGARKSATLSPAVEGVPSLVSGAGPAGYLPLDLFGIAATAVGDEDIVNFSVPSFTFGGHTYSGVGVTSNGYLVLGAGTAEDINFEAPPMPNPARPNNVIAPFWTDLNGTGAPGIYAATLTDGVTTWLVVEWRVFVFGTTSLQTFQTWIQLDTSGQIFIAYNPDNLPGDPNGQQFQVGVENRDGSAAASLPAGQLPTADLVATSTDPTAGGTVSYTVKVLGILPGSGGVETAMTTPIVPGTTEVSSTVKVKL